MPTRECCRHPRQPDHAANTMCNRGVRQMTKLIPNHFTGPTEVPADADLETRQWAEWRSSRRNLLKVGAFSGAGIALGGALTTASPFVRSAAAQDTPKSGGTIAMSLADDDVQNFDPIIPTDNMSIWTMLLIYDTLI